MALSNQAALDFHSIENDLLNPQTLSQLHYDSILSKPSLYNTLLKHVSQVHKEHTSTRPAAYTCTLAPQITLTLHIADATMMSMDQWVCNGFDAIYLDAFCPVANAECWKATFIKHLAGNLTVGGKLVTYSAKGDVRRAMLSAGLEVQKLRGPPGKREMLAGSRI